MSIQRYKKIKFFLFLLLIFFIGYIAGNTYFLPYKFFVKTIYQIEYQTKMYKCDNAMRNQFIAKARTAYDPSEKTVLDLQSSEVALIDCHDYDVIRKKLLTLGLNKLDLSAMGLKAIERESYDLQKIVRIHEIRY